MIRISIVEDEKRFVDQMIDYLHMFEKESHLKIDISIFTDGDQIVENYKAHFDIILMDIEMPFLNGMLAAEYIRRIDKEVIIIFITNMAQYAIKGYEVDALDYVLKPVSYFAFSQKLSRAIERMKNRKKNSITITTSNGLRRLEYSEIYWIESHGHRLIYHTLYEEYETTNTSMKNIEDKLRNGSFFRSNKGYLLNLEHVRGIQDNCAIINEAKLLISRSRKNEFLKALTNYVGGIVK